MTPNNTNGSRAVYRGEHEARELIAEGKKLRAILLVRTANGIEIQEAREVVERWSAEPYQHVPPAPRAPDEISAVRRIYSALLSQPEESRQRILNAAATLAGMISSPTPQ